MFSDLNSRKILAFKSYISNRMFYQVNTPYSANKSEQINIIKMASDSWKFFHLTLSQWLELKFVVKMVSPGHHRQMIFTKSEIQ